MIGIIKWLWSFRRHPRWEPMFDQASRLWGVRWSRPDWQGRFDWIGSKRVYADRDSAQQIAWLFERQNFTPHNRDTPGGWGQ